MLAETALPLSTFSRYAVSGFDSESTTYSSPCVPCKVYSLGGWSLALLALSLMSSSGDMSSLPCSVSTSVYT